MSRSNNKTEAATRPREQASIQLREQATSSTKKLLQILEGLKVRYVGFLQQIPTFLIQYLKTATD